MDRHGGGLGLPGVLLCGAVFPGDMEEALQSVMWNAAGGLLLENLAPGKALTGGCTGQAAAAADHRVYEGFCGDAPGRF